MFVPSYVAYLRPGIFRPIKEWKTPVNYSRPLAYNNPTWPALPAGLAAHNGIADAYTETVNMLPVMEQADPDDIPADNNGYNGFGYVEYFSDDARNYGFNDSQWTFEKLISYAASLYALSRVYQTAFVDAIQGRAFEDTWHTTVVHVGQPSYEADAAIFSASNERIRAGSFVYSPYSLTSAVGSDKVRMELVANACESTISAYSRLKEIQVKEYIDCYTAYIDGDAPVLEMTPKTPLVPRYVIPHTVGEPESEKKLINGYWYKGIRTPYSYSAAAELAFFAAGGKTIEQRNAELNAFLAQEDYEIYSDTGIVSTLETIPEEGGPFAGVAATYPGYKSVTGTPSLAASKDMLRVHFPDIADELDISERPWWYTVNYTYHRRMVNTSHGSYGWSLLTSGDEMAKAWDHNDPDFAGYVPYDVDLWQRDMNTVLSYAKNPTGIFDGFVFYYMVKVSQITRAWFTYIANEVIDYDYGGADPNEEFPLHLQRLYMNGWIDTTTGVFISRTSNDVCDVGSVTFSDNWLTSDLVEDPDNPVWEDYPFVDADWVLPPGEFFLQDGDEAPLYPTFTGAYFYDLHLKKWGKFVGEYKRLIDYQSINTFIAGQQSYARFGIFGGIIDADGTIRLFDEKPSNSWIKYGKIGYYRQGMTTPEEIRIHHRIPCTGKAKLETSLEGKNISWDLYHEGEFTSDNFWQLNGGYAGRWHNVVISGQYDLSYLEFRGIKQGKR